MTLGSVLLNSTGKSPVSSLLEKPTMEKVQFSSGVYQDIGSRGSFVKIWLCGVIRIHREWPVSKGFDPYATTLNTQRVANPYRSLQKGVTQKGGLKNTRIKSNRNQSKTRGRPTVSRAEQSHISPEACDPLKIDGKTAPYRSIHRKKWTTKMKSKSEGIKDLQWTVK